MTGPAGIATPALPPDQLGQQIELIELEPPEPISFGSPSSPDPEEIAYDDGGADAGWDWSNAGGAFAVRFTPSSYPVSLQTARICLADPAWYDPPWPDSDHEAFAVEIYDDDGVGGTPGTLLGSIGTTAANWGWWDVDISGLGITITSGDFYVAYKQLSDDPDCEALCADYGDHDGRAWAWNGVAWSRYGLLLDWMIRCVVEQSDCPWLSESPTSGSVAPGNSHDITVTVDTTGLAEGDYSAEIVIDSNDPDEDPKIVPVTLHVVEMPDLVISAKYEEWVDFEARSYNITYTVENQGDLAAGASDTTITIDGIDVLEDPVPILAVDANYTNTVGPFTMSGNSDNITVCADNDDVVAESNEANNCLENTWGTSISGVTTEVNCQPLDAVTLQLFDGEGVTPIGDPATSDGSGNYNLAAPVSETGSYEVVASKTGFRDETQSISITELGQEYTLDFRGDHGLIPNAPDMSYVLACVNRWLYPPSVECALTMSKVLAVVNAWLYPA